MPRNIRNFWIELTVDGKSTRITAGPQSSDGGFEMTIKMRDRGETVIAASVVGIENDGKLALIIRPGDAIIPQDDGGDIIIHTAR